MLKQIIFFQIIEMRKKSLKFDQDIEQYKMLGLHMGVPSTHNLQCLLHHGIQVTLG